MPCSSTRGALPTASSSTPRADWARVPGVVRALRATRYDVALDLQGLLKSAVLARRSGARRVLGFERAALREGISRRRSTRNGMRWTTRGTSSRRTSGWPRLRARAPGPIPFPIDVPPLPAGVEGPGRYVLLNPGAGWPNKQWPRRSLRGAGHVDPRAARAPIARRVGTTGAGARRHHCCRVARRGRAGAADVNWRRAGARAQAARLMVSGDTGPLHLAAAVGTPLVGLFGPTSPARNGPFDPTDESVSRFAGCVCHHERRCRRDVPCVATITFDEVREAVERRLAAPKVQRRQLVVIRRPALVEVQGESRSSIAQSRSPPREFLMLRRPCASPRAPRLRVRCRSPLARPADVAPIALGTAIGVIGEGVRFWAAGHLEKSREVTRPARTGSLATRSTSGRRSLRSAWLWRSTRGSSRRSWSCTWR